MNVLIQVENESPFSILQKKKKEENAMKKNDFGQSQCEQTYYMQSYKNKSENINTFNIYTFHGIPKIQHIFNTYM